MYRDKVHYNNLINTFLMNNSLCLECYTENKMPYRIYNLCSQYSEDKNKMFSIRSITKNICFITQDNTIEIIFQQIISSSSFLCIFFFVLKFIQIMWDNLDKSIDSIDSVNSLYYQIRVNE